ncbi:MAG: TolC family protein [bacterium]|nr:TolC family protein [bacterium]
MKRAAMICLGWFALGAGSPAAADSLTLEESKRIALRNNCEAVNSRLEADAAKQVRWEAFTKFFPAVSAGGLRFESQRNLFEFSTPGGNLPVYDGNPANLAHPAQFAYFPGMNMGMFKTGTFGTLTAVQPVFAGGRILNGNRLAALGSRVGKHQTRLSESRVVRETEERYWRVVSLDEKMKTLRAYEALLVRLEAQVEDAWASGVVMKNDVLKVRLRKNEILLNRSKLENGGKLARLAFCQYVGIPYDSALCLRDTMAAAGPPQALFVDDSAAVARRPEYRLLEESVRAEKLRTLMKLGEYLPQAGIGVSAASAKMDGGRERTVRMAFGTATVPISGWWEAAHAMKERRIRERIAQNSFEENRELLRLQIRKAWYDLADAYRQALLAEEVVVQAEENLAVNQDSYDNGLCTVSDLLEAQAMLQQALDRRTDGRAAYWLARTDYLQATGR